MVGVAAIDEDTEGAVPLDGLGETDAVPEIVPDVVADQVTEAEYEVVAVADKLPADASGDGVVE